MNLKKYAKMYIARYRLEDPKHGPHEGAVAKHVLKVIDLIREQGHNGGYLYVFIEMLIAILRGYMGGRKEDDPIWKMYWESDGGKKEDPE